MKKVNLIIEILEIKFPNANVFDKQTDEYIDEDDSLRKMTKEELESYLEHLKILQEKADIKNELKQYFEIQNSDGDNVGDCLYKTKEGAENYLLKMKKED